MDSVNDIYAASAAMSQLQFSQQIQTSGLIKQATNSQANSVMALIQAAVPQLATEGSLGTRLNTYA